MTDIKTQVQGLDPNLHARDVKQFVKDTGNIYESLAIIAKRAKQLSVDLKRELHEKLDEFAVNPETIEEVTENKEQIEISKFYERLPNPAVIATEEYLADGLHARFTDKKKKF
ncbi:MAG: DNA-directed RNA polymerase subunit omega [Saprospiraceae bacterium]|nr:DNA-directed RNA polymerase subunit omega [Saprospiraceae bacterium]